MIDDDIEMYDTADDLWVSCHYMPKNVTACFS